MIIEEDEGVEEGDDTGEVNLGAYSRLEHYPIENPGRYTGDLPGRGQRALFGRIGRLPGDRGGLFKTNLCKRRLGFPESREDEDYTGWVFFEMVLKNKLFDYNILDTASPIISGDRNDDSELWIQLLNELVDAAHGRFFIMSDEVADILRETEWSQRRRYYWHALDELVISYVHNGQKKYNSLKLYLKKKGGPKIGARDPTIRRNRKRAARQTMGSTSLTAV